MPYIDKTRRPYFENLNLEILNGLGHKEPFDFMDKNAVSTRLNELKQAEEQFKKDYPIFSGGHIELFGNKMPWLDNLVKFADVFNLSDFGSGVASHEGRIKEMRLLEEQFKKLTNIENKKLEIDKNNEKRNLSKPELNREFNKLWHGNDKNKSKNSKHDDEGHFIGFMSLDQAWNNRVLESMNSSSSPQLTRLDNIHKAGLGQIDVLLKVHNTLISRTFPGVFL